MRGYIVSTVSAVFTRRIDFTLSESTVTSRSIVFPDSMIDAVYTPGVKVLNVSSVFFFAEPDVICMMKRISRMTANRASTPVMTSSFSLKTTILVAELIIGSLHYCFV